IDSGLDVDFTISGRVAAQQSFILPMYGYSFTDTTTIDSNPDDGFGNRVRHGTIVSSTVLQNSDTAVIVNAKVIDSEGSATSRGIIAAIHWAISQNCSVINLSLGSTPSLGDPIEQAIEDAFSQGVIVVAAAGNEGEAGTTGTSISSPSVYTKAIAVGALDEDDMPADYTSYGPTAGRYMKPDICAEGFAETSTAIYFGTSFASPRVAGYVADIISHCISNNIEYTPGSITAALLSGAESLPYSPYIIGAGKADVNGAIEVIDGAPYNSGLPLITYVHPESLPLDFETIFSGDNYTFNAQIITSGVATYDLQTSGPNAGIIDTPSSVTLNQTGLVPISISVPDGQTGLLQGNVFFDAGLHNDSLEISFTASASSAKIAFDISHTPWDIDTVYGQFKELYLALVDSDISVTEIRDPSKLTSDYLANFDGIFVLDPCSWDIDETHPASPIEYSIEYTLDEIEAYKEYYFSGGGIFIAALDNSSLNINQANEFLSWTGISLNGDRIAGVTGPVLVDNIATHSITTGINDFDFLGASLSFNASAQSLASYLGHSILVAMEGVSSGRIVVTGTNFFLDNWGIRGLYGSSMNDVLALKIALWITGTL
ncbi:MAG: S8 family serine peptidase, partial [Candidatus Thorarchaeota archaeon]|nr:S8 family serine peptidase [Candidatus Thorarchaeota archaeon]